MRSACAQKSIRSNFQDMVIDLHAVLGGEPVIGDFSWVAPSVCLRDRIATGSGVTVGMGAIVTKDVPDGTTAMGVPARPIEEQRRLLRQLPDLLVEGQRTTCQLPAATTRVSSV